MPQPSYQAQKRRATIRLTPVVHLITGETVNVVAETPAQFDEQVRFGPIGERVMAERPSPAEWLANQIEAIAFTAHAHADARPIIVPTPIACLIDQQTPLLCDAAVRRTPICAQEICLEASDADLSVPNADVRKGIENLRRKGFRVSVNATQSCEAHLSTALRLLLDNIRINGRDLDGNAALEDKVEAAQACGMAVIAENAAWRDGEYLATLGIEYGIRPLADA